MRDDLLAQLDEWHEEDEYERIVDAIMEVPAEDRDYELVSHLGRAMNNLERYEEAIEQFLSVAEEGGEDPLWHYRIGLAYYYVDRYEDALREFEAADKLEPGDEDTLEFLDDIRGKMDSEAIDEQAAEPVEETHAEDITESVTEPAAELDTSAEASGFWDDSEHALEQYVSEPPTDEMVESVEEKLVFKLPASYIEMMKLHNGGIPRNRCFPIGEAVSEAKGHVTISSILGIGQDKKHSLCGELGSRFIIEHGGYPEIGVVICDCPSDSEVVMLDYRESLNDGEPEVVHVDKGSNYRITKLAPNFEAFIRGLVNENDAYKGTD